MLLRVNSNKFAISRSITRYLISLFFFEFNHFVFKSAICEYNHTFAICRVACNKIIKVPFFDERVNMFMNQMGFL